MLLSEKLTLIIILMTTIILIISGDNPLELFFIMILIGVLILRELIETIASSDLKDRINFFIYAGLIIFIVIIVEKIIYILA